MSAVNPWDVDPALKHERLALLARLAIRIRNQAHAEANWAAGDTSWGVGCKAHERFAHAVTKLVASGAYPWLRVSRDGLSFLSVVEGVAIRTYHGNADKPQAKYLQSIRGPGADGKADRQLGLPFEADDDPWVWLMAVETDNQGKAERVVFFQATVGGETRHRWAFTEENAPGTTVPLFPRKQPFLFDIGVATPPAASTRGPRREAAAFEGQGPASSVSKRRKGGARLSPNGARG